MNKYIKIFLILGIVIEVAMNFLWFLPFSNSISLVGRLMILTGVINIIIAVFKKWGKRAILSVFFVSLLVFGYFVFGFGFGCGLGMGTGFDCRVLLPTSFYLLIIYIVLFCILSITYWLRKERVGNLILVISLIMLALIISNFIFASNYKNIPLYLRMQYFENKTLEKCSSDSCLMEIFLAQVHGGASPSVRLCQKMSDSNSKSNCLLVYDALVNNNFNACLNIISPVGLGNHYGLPEDPAVWGSRVDRDYCYRKVAMQDENIYVKPSPYISIFSNDPWDAYTPEECAQEPKVTAKNYCFYVTGRCNNIESAPIMQEDCRAYYQKYYPEHYKEL